MTESVSTEIFVLGVKPKLVLPRNSRAMTRLSNARTAGECGAITAAKAKAVGPLALPGAADAALCTTVSAKAGIKAEITSFFIGTPPFGTLSRLRYSIMHQAQTYGARSLAAVDHIRYGYIMAA